jgi:hypothetical protein
MTEHRGAYTYDVVTYRSTRLGRSSTPVSQAPSYQDTNVNTMFEATERIRSYKQSTEAYTFNDTSSKQKTCSSQLLDY